jgi:LacI family transcriptional regulator
VLQNSASVKEDTRKAVRKAMADIGYVYNRSAANMRSANAGLVGLVINDLRNPFFTEFATSLQMALSERGYSAVVANTDEDTKQQDQVVRAMIEHGVSAFIICPAYGTDVTTFDDIARAGIPAMQMLRKVENRFDLFPFVAPDYLAGSRAATEHLLSQGAKKIAFVGGLDGRAVTEERKAGFLAVLGEKGQSPIIKTGRADRAFGREIAMELAANQPDVDGAVCFNDLVALGMMAGFQEVGRHIGKDFSIVGFDDIEEAAQVYPPLSSVSCGIADLGKQTAVTVLKWLEDRQVPQHETRTPIALSVRKSSQLDLG